MITMIVFAAKTDNGNKGFSSNSKKTRCEMWVCMILP